MQVLKKPDYESKAAKSLIQDIKNVDKKFNNNEILEKKHKNTLKSMREKFLQKVETTDTPEKMTCAATKYCQVKAVNHETYYAVVEWKYTFVEFKYLTLTLTIDNPFDDGRSSTDVQNGPKEPHLNYELLLHPKVGNSDYGQMLNLKGHVFIDRFEEHAKFPSRDFGNVQPNFEKQIGKDSAIESIPIDLSDKVLDLMTDFDNVKLLENENYKHQLKKAKEIQDPKDLNTKKQKKT